MSFRKRFQEHQAGFQMAPMIDVIFLLLIFFMVSFIYAQWETKIGIEVPTSESGVQSGRQLGEIIINLDADGVIYVNSVEMSVTRLEQLLDHLAKTFRGHPVIIRADRETNYEAVIAVLDICRQVDIWNISFATLPQEVPASAP